MHELIIPPDINSHNISKYFLYSFHLIKNRFYLDELKKYEPLASEPTKDELKLIIPNFKSEVGLLRLRNTHQWFLIKGDLHEIIIPPALEKKADIIAHTHPSEIALDLPMTNDVLLVQHKRVEFIIHQNGITYFSGINKNPLTEKKLSPKNFEDLDELYESFIKAEVYRLDHDTNDKRKYEDAYKEDILDKLGITIIRKTWQELPDKNPLSGFSMQA
jgi:hypothetical protein